MGDVRELYKQMAAVLDRQAMPPLASDFDFARSEIDEVWTRIEVIDERTYQAENPWDAAVICMDLMANLASGVPLDESKEHIKDSSDLDSLPAMHFVFRGEGDFSYALCPSFYREYNNGRRHELERAVNNFAQMLKYASDECFRNIPGGNPNFNLKQFVGAAQHYLGNTPFMDWTTDPCVAVGFGANYDPKDNLSVVYGVPAYRAVQQNGTYYMPPPFVERLYLQRGFFIETAERDDDVSLQNACVSIRFREDRDFRVMRNGVEIPNLMKPLPVLDSLAEYAKEQAALGIQFVDDKTKSVEVAQNILREEWRKIGGIPDFLQAENAEEHAENWRKALIDMIERLTHLKTNEGLRVNKFLLRPVVCSNIQMMKTLRNWLRVQEEWARETAKNEDASRGWGQLADVIEESLDSCK